MTEKGFTLIEVLIALIFIAIAGDAGTRSQEIGIGAPSTPVISVGTNAQGSVIIGTTSGQIFSQKTFSPTSGKLLLYWREVVP